MKKKKIRFNESNHIKRSKLFLKKALLIDTCKYKYATENMLN